MKKQKPRLTRIIGITIINSFTGEWLVRGIMPFDPNKSMNGKYSQFYREILPAIANIEKVPKEHIIGEVSITTGKTDRLIIELSSGTKLDAPFDMDKEDYEILEYHLKGIELACKRK